MLETLLGAILVVVVPLAVAGAAQRDRQGRFPSLWRGAVFTLPVTLGCAVGALTMDPGPRAGWLAVPWLVTASLLGLAGFRRLLARGWRPFEETCIDLGLVFLPVGAAWLVASRAGHGLLGFEGRLVPLTAAHFLAAGFALPVVTGLVGRLTPDSGIWPLAGAGIVAGVPLTALGITLTRHAGITSVERAAAWLLVMSVLLLVCVVLTRVVRRVQLWPALLLGLGALGLPLSMAMAAGYAAFGGPPAPVVTAPGGPGEAMLWLHGAVNVAALALLLTALVLVAPDSRARPAGVPLSKLTAGRFRVGADWLSTLGSPPATRAPRGLVDDFDVYARPGFDTARVHPDVRAFYERTAEHRLLVRPTWRFPMSLAGRAWLGLARRMEQMNFPRVAEGVSDAIESRIVPVRDDLDGRSDVRAWVRTYDRGRAMYVALYSTLVRDGVATMNIAFPMWGANMTSVLHLSPFGDGGVSLTSLSHAHACGDQGVYLVTGLGVWRLPINETIEVWPAGDGRVAARHHMWVCGLRFVTLDYTIAVQRLTAA